MAKPNYIELPNGEPVPILYEDRAVLAIDKPAGWMLAPLSWQNTSRNLQAALEDGIQSKAFWARSRNLKYLRFVHRLDAETTGVLLLARSPGALRALSGLFESRGMQKTYVAVVQGVPKTPEWSCRLKLAPEPQTPGKVKVDAAQGKEAETRFRLLQAGTKQSLVEAQPLTGRTHQIRVHLTATGYPILGDPLYGSAPSRHGLALRAASLSYSDPFTRRQVEIRAPLEAFALAYGFEMGRQAPGLGEND